MKTIRRLLNDRQSPSWRGALGVLAFCQLVIAIDFNIVYVALPDIAALGFSPHGLQWVISAYAVGFGGLLLLGGRLSDRFGARRMLLLGLALFAAACAAGAAAPDPATLVVFRAAQGVGAALVTPAMLALILRLFSDGPPRHRALAAWGAAGSGGLALGALAGGVLTEAVNWRATLAVLTPLALLALIWGRAVLPGDTETRSENGFDVAGAVLGTAAGALVVVGLAEGPEVGWLTVRGGGALVAAVLLGGAFVGVERRHPKPLVDLAVVRRPGTGAALVLILMFQSALLGGYFVFTTYAQGIRGATALETGLAFLPLTLVSMFASLALTGRALRRFGLRRTLTGALAVNTAGLATLAAAMSTGGPAWLFLLTFAVWGIGGGITFPVMFAAAADSASPQAQAQIPAVATTAQQVGGAAGLALVVAAATAGAGGADELRTGALVAAGLSLAALLTTTMIARRTAADVDA